MLSVIRISSSCYQPLWLRDLGQKSGARQRVLVHAVVASGVVQRTGTEGIFRYFNPDEQDRGRSLILSSIEKGATGKL